MLGRGNISHYSKYWLLFSTLSVYSTLISILLRDDNAVFLCHCDFYLFNDGAADMRMCQCRVSDTQVTVKACGPLVFHTSKLYLCLKTV